MKQKERMLLNLTVRVVDQVRNFTLVKLLSQIVNTLMKSMESRITRLMRSEGRILAEKISKIAKDWGHHDSKSWATDTGFIQYLTVINMGALG
ncbi:MAG: hypothetical protein ACOWW1_00790 [archaeon]